MVLGDSQGGLTASEVICLERQLRSFGHGFRRSSEVPAIFLENRPWPPWKVENAGHMWALIWVLHGLIKSYLKISENDRKNTGNT